MNKLLIAFVLAIVMSGNVYANLITDLFKSEREMCLEAVEKGTFVKEYINNYSVVDPEYYSKGDSNRIYMYKGKSYKYYYKTDRCYEGVEVHY